MSTKRLPDRTVNLALVGCGEVTRYKHLPSIQFVPGIRVAAVADEDLPRAQQAAQIYGVSQCFRCVEEVLEVPGIDAVGVCVPPSAHSAVALPALRAGKSVWIDKPLALTMEDCRAIREAAAGSGASVVMGFHMRWHRLVTRAREMIRDGALGEIESIRCVWNSPRADEGLPEWRWRRDTGGGALVELGVHHFDLWRYLLEREVEQVFAVSQDGVRDDEAAVVMARMEGGALATAAFSERSPHEIEIEVCGSQGRLRVDCLRFDGFEHLSVRDVPGKPSARLRNFTEFWRSLPGGLKLMRRNGDYRDSYRRAWEHFARVVRGDEVPGASIEDGCRATEISQAALEASPRNRQ